MVEGGRLGGGWMDDWMAGWGVVNGGKNPLPVATGRLSI